MLSEQRVYIFIEVRWLVAVFRLLESFWWSRFVYILVLHVLSMRVVISSLLLIYCWRAHGVPGIVTGCFWGRACA